MINSGAPKTDAAATRGWAMYRPDGTLFRFYGDGEMGVEREANILSDAWDEIQPEDCTSAGTPMPHAANEARRLGYRVVAVTVMPSVPEDHL